jgi:branched-chain amino acid transport system permease protein
MATSSLPFPTGATRERDILPARRGTSRLWPTLLLVVALGVLPLVGSDYLFEAILTPFLVLSLAALGLNLLTGYAGQLSLGTAAFMAVGAYAAYNLELRVPGMPLLLSFFLGGGVAAAVGLVFGVPSLRLRGFYLAVSTLAAQFFLPWTLTKFGWFSNHSASGVISAPPLQFGPLALDAPTGRYLLVLAIVAALTFLAARLVGSPLGRNFIAVRDDEVAARVIGVPVLRVKLLAFTISSFYVGVAGALWAFCYLRTIEPHGFDLSRSFQILFMIIIGGIASIRGSFLGAAFISVLPLLLSRAGNALVGGAVDAGTVEILEKIITGLLIIGFLIAEPRGLSALFDRVRARVSRRQHPA